MRVLVVMPDFPYPPNHGGKSDMLYRLKALASASDIEVDLIATISTPIDEMALEHVKRYASNVILAKRIKSIFAQLHILPYQVVSRRSLADIELPTTSYDLVILENDYVGKILDNTRLNAHKKVIRVQNDESRYFASLAKASSGLARIYYLIESCRFRFYSPKLFNKTDALLYISQEECATSAGGSEYRKWLPPAIDLSQITARRLGTGRVLYVGSLFMPNNAWALKWYLETVHQELKNLNKAYKFVVAGNARGTDVSWLEKYHDIEIYFDPTDSQIEELYANSSVFVAPIFHGAGVKIKNINALVNGLPVVTTSIGNEGSGLQNGVHLIVADKPMEFAAEVNRLLSNTGLARNMVLSGQDYLRKNYDQLAILVRLINTDVKGQLYEEELQ